MGCDIHMHAEVKIRGEWHYYGEIELDRNYAMFTYLANVRPEREREDDFEPISEPRGLPDDITFMTRFYAEEVWGVDGHSHSWINSDEIAEYEAFLDRKGWLFPEDQFSPITGYLFGNYWGPFKEYPHDYPDDLEDVRFVFWFDN